MNPSTKTLSERLTDGARMLGNLWHRGKRCKLGFDIAESDIALGPCPCEKKNDFCRARELWLKLAMERGQEIEVGSSAMVFVTMSPGQLDATGVTLTVESEKAGVLRIGPKGTMSAAYLRKLAEDPKSALSIFGLTKAFPKARVEGVVEPQETQP